MTEAVHFDLPDEIVEIPLVADPDQRHELRDPGLRLIDEQEIGDNRITVARVALPLLSTSEVVAAAFEARFHPAPGDRFGSAHLSLILKDPAEARILDIEPKRLTEGEAVTRKRVAEASLNVQLWGVLGGRLVSRTEVSFESYHVFLEGGLHGARRARWRLTENPDRAAGIPPKNRFAVVATRFPDLRAELMVSVQLVRPGLGGVAEAVRRLIPMNRTVPFDLNPG